LNIGNHFLAEHYTLLIVLLHGALQYIDCVAAWCITLYWLCCCMVHYTLLIVLLHGALYSIDCVATWCIILYWLCCYMVHYSILMSLF